MMIKPPPAPTSPVITPSVKPSKDTKKELITVLAFCELLLFLSIERAEKSIKTANKTIKKSDLDTINPSISNTVCGILGKIYFRVRKTEIIDGIPKIKAVLNEIFLLKYFGTTPTNLVEPTTKSE